MAASACFAACVTPWSAISIVLAASGGGTGCGGRTPACVAATAAADVPASGVTPARRFSSSFIAAAAMRDMV